MLSRPLSLLALVVACAVGAAAGAYFALREPRAPVAPAATDMVASAERGATSAAVAETEGPVASATSQAPRATERVSAVSGPLTSAAEPVRPGAGTPAALARAGGRAERGARRPSVEPTRPPASAASASGTLDRPWPSESTGAPRVPAGEPALAAESAQPIVPAPPVPEPPPAAAREFIEVVVQSGAVIGLQLDTPLTSETAKPEDRVEARVTRDVRAADRVAIPAGTLVRGSVVLVERGGKFKERARLGVRFHTLVLADGTEVPIETEPIYREGASPAGESAAKIGGAAVAGAILGGILGGGRGAAVGGAVGAAGGTAATMAGDRNAVTLPAGTALTVRLSAPVTVAVEK